MKTHQIVITFSILKFIFSFSLILLFWTLCPALQSTLQEDMNVDSVLCDSLQANESENILAKGKTEVSSIRELSSLKIFDYKSRFSLGISLPYFYYCESIKGSDVQRSFIEQFGTVPDTFIGAPKSTEYGFLPGMSFNYTHTSKIGLFIQPAITFMVGLNNTYDGSSQGQPIINQNNDTVGLSYTPIKDTKRNIFLDGSFKLGYLNSSYSTAFSFYTGLNANLWNRDFKSTKYICNYENYFWYSIPLGVEVYFINKPTVILGMKLEATLMFYGQMHAYLYERGNKNNGIDYPSLQLGHKAGYHFSIDAGKILREHLLIKVSPFVTFYGFGKSDTKQATLKSSYSSSTEQKAFKFYEPESATLLTGLSIKFILLSSASDNQKESQ